MDKRAKKPERPKLRKEDIGTPVNFVHVQHVGFGGGGGGKSISQSACTSPTFENMDPFFAQQNFRTSGNSFNPGKENRFSNGPTALPYGSMSNLSILSSTYDNRNHPGGSSAKFAGVSKQKSAKYSFSGSLLNLSFFPFSSKSSSVAQQERSRGSKSEHCDTNIRTKRLSLGVGFSSGPGPVSSIHYLPSRPLTGPPCTPPLPPQPEQDATTTRPHVRRRSSSFNGESDFPTGSQMTREQLPFPPSLTLNRHLQNTNKKQKMGFLPPPLPYSPPLSPNYDELPPPPDMSFDTNNSAPSEGLLESPSYEEVNLPPPMSHIVPRKMSLTRHAEFPLPPPPASPPSTPPPLPTSPPPIANANRVGYKFHPLKSKLIRVNAPTLPPLSVPLVRPKNQSPGTPSTWPLEPGVPQLCGQNLQDGSGRITKNSPSEELNLSIEELLNQKACSSTYNVDSSHVEPLSKLFQCRLSHDQWPIMMNKLFSRAKEGVGEEIAKDGEFVKIYNNLLQNTLQLWLKLEGGQTTLENVVAAFEQTQDELLKDDCGDNVTKL
ncbi:ras-associated and pleckstrin homology domains-containing protein 1 isoform X2 [Folsomia candida]|uniref:ras-associated and pleckstrin homology domains-containing protein 1 isoform X2 n=1 Tax=Folsomia candida TaxID=158441 RepID=UPI0016055C39|nr:ras-associated and pleckstrin homology domains-containing protein 1 isoform X2 [Folsomia candida]